MIKKLSPTKLKVYNLYKKYISNNILLTYQKASEILDIQVSAIFKHVKDLVDLGYLEKRSDGSIILTDTSETTNIPLLGTIACGNPIYIFEENQTIKVSSDILKGSGDFYALQAKGDSMINSGIVSGDILIIRHQNNVDDGDIGVLIEKDEFDEYATLKQIFHTKSGVLAKPKNQLFEPFIIANHKAEIRGKLVGVVRNFN